ncbi:MAG: isopenicillin N synthase family oxygenase [Alphaproteobacteria bacterium]|nr:isopenicillin N synthase family oxygenase [Alphaproteobacteria bacterium]
MDTVLTRDITRVPLVDFADFETGSAGRRRDIGAEIAEVCGSVGFFYLANHGIAATLVERMFAAAKEFFDLPPAEKEAISFDKSRTRRGYLGLQQENFARARGTPGDLKEFINFGFEFPPDTPEVVACRPYYGGNQWPAGLPGWRAAVVDYMHATMTLGRSLMRAVALGLDLPEDRFEAMLARPMSSFRLLHYPPQALRPPIADETGCGAHTDYGCLTMLAQDDIGGLQVQTRDGGWIDVPQVAGTFVINIGDMLQFWTAGRLRSTPHRVGRPAQQSRYSVAAFLTPHIDTPLAPLDGGTGEPSATLTAGEHYLKQMTANAY